VYNAGLQPRAQKKTRKKFAGLRTFTIFAAVYVSKFDIEQMNVLQNRIAPNEMYDEVLLSRTGRSSIRTNRSSIRTYQSLIRTYISLIRTYRSLIRTNRSLIRTYRSLIRTYRSSIRTNRSLIRTYISSIRADRSLIRTDWEGVLERVFVC
jgi:phosphoenolpyruvate carboxylase